MSLPWPRRGFPWELQQGHGRLSWCLCAGHPGESSYFFVGFVEFPFPPPQSSLSFSFYWLARSVSFLASFARCRAVCWYDYPGVWLGDLYFASSAGAQSFFDELAPPPGWLQGCAAFMVGCSWLSGSPWSRYAKWCLVGQNRGGDWWHAPCAVGSAWPVGPAEWG